LRRRTQKKSPNTIVIDLLLGNLVSYKEKEARKGSGKPKGLDGKQYGPKNSVLHHKVRFQVKNCVFQGGKKPGWGTESEKRRGKEGRHFGDLLEDSEKKVANVNLQTGEQILRKGNTSSLKTLPISGRNTEPNNSNSEGGSSARRIHRGFFNNFPGLTK